MTTFQTHVQRNTRATLELQTAVVARGTRHVATTGKGTDDLVVAGVSTKKSDAMLFGRKHFYTQHVCKAHADSPLA